MYLALPSSLLSLLSPYSDTTDGIEFKIGLVADMDERSKVDATTWGSFLKVGTLTLHKDWSLSVQWQPDMVELRSHISEGGRGAELSELIAFNGKLYTVDDRTGIGKWRGGHIESDVPLVDYWVLYNA